uniref:Putative secreted protein n=1 Tax=Rhipicephalus microplus TaxID=6941 RepID=A0A6M2D9U9_RHIMP
MFCFFFFFFCFLSCAAVPAIQNTPPSLPGIPAHSTASKSINRTMGLLPSLNYNGVFWGFFSLMCMTLKNCTAMHDFAAPTRQAMFWCCFRLSKTNIELS